MRPPSTLDSLSQLGVTPFLSLLNHLVETGKPAGSRIGLPTQKGQRRPSKHIWQRSNLLLCCEDLVRQSPTGNLVQNIDQINEILDTLIKRSCGTMYTGKKGEENQTTAAVASPSTLGLLLITGIVGTVRPPSALGSLSRSGVTHFLAPLNHLYLRLESRPAAALISRPKKANAGHWSTFDKEATFSCAARIWFDSPRRESSSKT